ncbi:CRISPR-associated endonuclease Cas2 [Erysipelotrichaceae bacterium RD49]|nr:CRISPR-associated endonuclease Cas2 [Erysipelotrichaceae bacterium RD49]
MNIICVYDISGSTSIKAMHILRKYLFHVQHSVFQGKLTPSQFRRLQKELSQIEAH